MSIESGCEDDGALLSKAARTKLRGYRTAPMAVSTAAALQRQDCAAFLLEVLDLYHDAQELLAAAKYCEISKTGKEHFDKLKIV